MKYFFILLVLIPATTFSQKSNVYKVSSNLEMKTKFARGWIKLDSGWKFTAGDNLSWARPEFNDSAWNSINLFQDLYNVPGLSKNGITWFRLKFMTDSTLNKELVLRIYQTGASEIFLDGKLIHSLGTVASNPDSIRYYSPNMQSLSFPATNNTGHVLAIRFANSPNRYPLYLGHFKSFLSVWVSTVDNAYEDYITKYYRTFNSRINVGVGVAAMLCVLYLSFFIFFPAQKINLYFSLCNCLFTIYMALASSTLHYHEAPFAISFIVIIFLILYLLMLVYCTYKVFDQKFGWAFWSFAGAGIISVPAVFLVDDGLISTLMGVMALVIMLGVSIKSLRNNKVGARIILVCMAIDLLFWTFYLLSMLSVVNIPGIDAYIPFALLIAPLSLAIYLGYAFGTTSQSLRQKLIQVEQLSNEKQQLLSSQNETLEIQVKERTSALNQSLENLKSAQAQLIHSEKMASLGQLTAGIAHEIQNPLNFVNNFSEVNKELVEELRIKNEKLKIEDEEIKGLLSDIKDNEEKISHHGKRADAIVKGMLQHSRTSIGQKEPTDINALADEYLRLSYHGLRAKDKTFNATLRTDFDKGIGMINVIPQDIGRVFLNLFTNAFYEVNEKKNASASPAGQQYQPTVSVTTKKINGKIEIRVADNGNGIPQKVLDKIFQPFFTTKPTGQGTGLGLSLSYDIIKAHGGEIKVNTKEARPDDQVGQGEGSEFLIYLPA